MRSQLSKYAGGRRAGPKALRWMGLELEKIIREPVWPAWSPQENGERGERWAGARPASLGRVSGFMQSITGSDVI